MDIELPVGIGSLIDEFVRERCYVPDDAVAVRSIEDLPTRFLARIQEMPADAQWRAWMHECHFWFIVAQRVRQAREDTQSIVLKMTFHDQDAARAACAAWMRQPGGKWLLHSVPADSCQDEVRSSAWREAGAGV